MILWMFDSPKIIKNRCPCNTISWFSLKCVVLILIVLGFLDNTSIFSLFYKYLVQMTSDLNIFNIKTLINKRKLAASLMKPKKDELKVYYYRKEKCIEVVNMRCSLFL